MLADAMSATVMINNHVCMYDGWMDGTSYPGQVLFPQSGRSTHLNCRCRYVRTVWKYVLYLCVRTIYVRSMIISL